jgi:hypothetical protein
MSVLAGFRLVCAGLPPNVVLSIYTFGAPRVGDKRFPSLFDPLIPDTHQIRNKNDRFSRFPPIYVGKTGMLLGAAAVVVTGGGAAVVIGVLGAAKFTPSDLYAHVGHTVPGLYEPDLEGAGVGPHLMCNYLPMIEFSNPQTKLLDVVKSRGNGDSEFFS